MEKRFDLENYLDENFDDIAMRQITFKAAWKQSPIGKAKFEELARAIGEQGLNTKKGFYSLMQSAGLSAVVETYHDGMMIDRQFIFDGLFAIPYLPA